MMNASPNDRASTRLSWRSPLVIVAVVIGLMLAFAADAVVPEPVANGLGAGVAVGIVAEVPNHWPARPMIVARNALLLGILFALPAWAIEWAVSALF